MWGWHSVKDILVPFPRPSDFHLLLRIPWQYLGILILSLGVHLSLLLLLQATLLHERAHHVLVVGSGDNMHGEEAYGRAGAHALGEDTCMENLQLQHLLVHDADHVVVAGRDMGSFQLRVNEVMGAVDELLLGDVHMVEVGDERRWPGYKDH